MATKVSHLKARVQLQEDHPDSLVKSCVTRAREFQDLALYKDEKRRLYRPRLGLTEEDIGMEIQEDVGESVVWMDCYIQPLVRRKDDKFLNQEKSGPPEIGEIVLLRSRQSRSSDRRTVKEFTAYVSEVHWGGFTRTNIFRDLDRGAVERSSDSLGLVRLEVQDPQDRSLLFDTDYNIRSHRLPVAA